MIEPTIFNIIGVVVGAFGVLFTLNGLRAAFWDEFGIGVILLIIAWIMLL